MLPFAPLGKVGREHFLALPGAMLGRHPPARPATHCPARPTPRCGVTAPPLTPLTKGGGSSVATLRVSRRGWQGAVPPVTPNCKTSRRERREVASLWPVNGPQGFSRDRHAVASLHPAAEVP